MRSTPWMIAALASALVAQCPDQGGRPVAAGRFEASSLTCGDLPQPDLAWCLHVPAHRALARMRGRTVVSRRHRPCTLVEFRCTGLVLWPVLPARRIAAATVLDVGDDACAR